MNSQDSHMAMSSITHWAEMTAENVRLCFTELVSEQMRPSVTMRPAISIDGNQWCALYGEDLQRGVAGFGDSPEQAMLAFDREWGKPLGGASKGTK